MCSKQECAQLEVCNFSKMMVHRESLTQIGLRAEKNVAKHLLGENGWESNLVAHVSKVDFWKATKAGHNCNVFGHLPKEEVVSVQKGLRRTSGTSEK